MWWGLDGAGHVLAKDPRSGKNVWVRLAEQYRREMAEARGKYDRSVPGPGKGRFSKAGDVWVATTTAPKIKPPIEL